MSNDRTSTNPQLEINVRFFNTLGQRIRQENALAEQDQGRFPRSGTPRARRPTQLLNQRNRSESPLNRQRYRPIDPHLSPSPTSLDEYDLEKMQQELVQKSGVLRFGSETVTAKMDDFLNEGTLGEGTCSDVFLSRHKARSDWVMAVKRMRRSTNCHEENRRIIKDLSVVTRSNDCRFIVECFGIFISKGEVWICMEVMSTCLDKLLKCTKEPFPEPVIGKVTVSMIIALNYLKEKHNIMHRDVKPSNMLMSEQGVVKLCDFGISGKLKDSIARSRQLGCIGYMAPERLEHSQYDVRADIWSLGISLLELASGIFPYTGSEAEFAVMSRILADPSPTLPSDRHFSGDFRVFIDNCLLKDCYRRPKYKQLMQLTFFRRHYIDPLDVEHWYRSLPHRQAARHQLGAQNSSASSGYGSTGSDSSPGSLGSQSRSPSSSRTDAPPPCHTTECDPCPGGAMATASGSSPSTATGLQPRVHHVYHPPQLPTIPQGSLPGHPSTSVNGSIPHSYPLTGSPAMPTRQRNRVPYFGMSQGANPVFSSHNRPPPGPPNQAQAAHPHQAQAAHQGQQNRVNTRSTSQPPSRQNWVVFDS